MAFPPRAFMIGAQKAGTTSLAELLGQHPGIVVSDPKEPDYFNVHWEKGIDWYRARFARHEGVLLEASVSYSMARDVEWDRGTDREVPQRIHALSPDAKFIYVVRDPAERCYSAYWHEVRARGEKQALRDVVSRKIYYTMGSYYHLQISRYLPFFPLDRFLIVDFRRLAKEPEAVAKECAAFIGAGHPEFGFKRDRPKNQAYQPNRLGKALDRFSNLSQLIPAPVRPMIRKMLSRDIPPLSPADKAWILDHFREDTLAFEKLTGIGFLTGAQERADERVSA